MIKWLLVIGVVSFVYIYFIKKKPIPSNTLKKNDTSKSEINEMVECSVCKTYCEVSDMILSGSKYYCSQECLKSAQC